MITNLSIKNYALIDDISVSFGSGLTVITGETGAGKSILLGALSLLLGKRADLSNTKNTSKKCVIEGEFTFNETNIQDVFQKNDLDYDSQTFIRREILPSGKSRAFVNDTPVSLQQLKSLAPYLIDIHSQNDTLDLFSEKFQLEVIDVLAGNSDLLTTYRELLSKYTSVSETIADLLYKKESAVKELDYNTFLFKELEEANLIELNQKELEETYETLNNSESIQEVFSMVIQLLAEEQIGALETLKESRVSLSKIKNYAANYEEIWKRLNSVIIELEDVKEEIEQEFNKVEADPKLLIEVNYKLQTLYKLQQKHSLLTVSELLQLQEKLASKIAVTNNLDFQILELEEKQEKLKIQAKDKAKKIHSKRVGVIPLLKDKLKEYLNDLGLPNAAFKFEISISEKFRNTGTDQLQLLFTANKGMAFGPLKKVASGGELSRIMLAIKAVLAQYKKLPTLIFDEIDTGVSGDVSYKMAAILNEMSKSMQLFSITHLPQVAAKGKHHIKIFKEDVNEVTNTKLKVLTKEERIAEIAEMIGGKEHSETAIKQAKELLN